jgi:hypothetical protein
VPGKTALGPSDVIHDEQHMIEADLLPTGKADGCKKACLILAAMSADDNPTGMESMREPLRMTAVIRGDG